MNEIAKKKGKILPKIIIGLILTLILLFAYMHFLEPHQLEIIEYAIINEKIPASFQGFKIAHFSDIHFGNTTNEPELKQVINTIQKIKPDVIVFTGDLTDAAIILSEDTKQNITEILKNAKATIGKFAILGDQDYLQPGIEDILKNAGFTVLKNQNIPIYYKGNTPIYISGIPSISKGEEDINKALEKESAYQILLMHEPTLFDEADHTDLVLAGHTLGGLIRLPGWKVLTLPNSGNYSKGKYQKDNSTLIVSSGVGTQQIPLRFANYPSINLYRLYNN